MAGRLYTQETVEQERARKRNELRRAISSMFINAGIALGATAVADFHHNMANPPIEDLWWFLMAFGIICVSLYIISRVEPEF